MSEGEYAKKLREAGDNYKLTVLALKAFANEMLFDDSSRKPRRDGTVSSGRRMTTSGSNRRSPSTDVTPDLVVRHIPTCAVVAEAKLGFPKDEPAFTRRIDETVEQLEKYDDDLVGWCEANNVNGTVSSHDLVLLVNHEDSRRVARELKARVEAKSLALQRKFALIAIAVLRRSEGEWPELELEHGILSDSRKTQKLENRLPIKPSVLESSPVVGLVQFYDVKPPMPVLMNIVHDTIIEHLSRENLEEHHIEGQTHIGVTLKELCQWASEYAFPKFDSRDIKCPEESWIEEAMDEFARLGWAVPAAGKEKAWEYVHKKGRKGYSEPYERFIEFCTKRALVEELKKQKAAEREELRLARRKQVEAAKFPLFADVIEKKADVGTEDTQRKAKNRPGGKAN